MVTGLKITIMRDLQQSIPESGTFLWAPPEAWWGDDVTVSTAYCYFPEEMCIILAIENHVSTFIIDCINFSGILNFLYCFEYGIIYSALLNFRLKKS